MKFLQELAHLPPSLSSIPRETAPGFGRISYSVHSFPELKLSVHFFQCSHQTFAVIPVSLRLQYIRSIHMRAFPFPCPQIMSFIDQKNILRKYPPRKIFQINIGIKYIIIITDHSVTQTARSRHISKGHLPFLRIFQQSILSQAVLRGPQFKNSIIHSVQMSSRPQTVLRIAFCFIAACSFSFAVMVITLNFSPCSFNMEKASSATVPGNGLCCKIENIFPVLHQLLCRKDRGHGLFSRCLDKNLSFCGYSVIYTGYDFRCPSRYSKGTPDHSWTHSVLFSMQAGMRSIYDTCPEASGTTVRVLPAYIPL